MSKYLINPNKNVSSQLAYSNSTYVIKHDIVLSYNVTIPANCVLEFYGGSLSGAYTITGNNTKIVTTRDNIFKNGILIAGTWSNEKVYSSWFSDITEDNRLKQLMNFSNSSKKVHIVVEQGTYNVSCPENNSAPLFFESNDTILELNGSIVLAPNSYDISYIIKIERDNIQIFGTGELVGDYLLGHTGETGGTGSAIWTMQRSNISIKGITVRNFWGNGITIGYKDADISGENVTVDGCSIHDCSRQGISIANAHLNCIKNCHIYHIYGIESASCGVCIEGYAIHNTIENNHIVNRKCIVSDAVNTYYHSIKENILEYSEIGILITNNAKSEIVNNRISYVSGASPDDPATIGTTYGVNTTRDCNIENNMFIGSVAVPIISEGSIITNNNIVGNTITITNCTFSTNALECIALHINGVCKVTNNSGSLGIQTSGYAVLLAGSCYFINNNIRSAGGTPAYVFTVNGVDGETSRLFIKNNILYTPNSGYVVCQSNSYAKEIYFEDNFVDYTVSIEVNSIGKYKNISIPVKRGSTAELAALNLHTQYKGVKAYDTTLNKDVMWDGTNWVDILGNPVNTVYPKVVGTPTAGNLAKFNSTDSHDIEDAGVAPQV